MEKITAQHPLSHSTDIVKENLETLKRLFPTIVKEGKIDVDELKALLDEEIESNEEYYRFSWAGKSEARREANKPSTATLRPNKVDSKNWDTTGNIFIEGDNLEVLKLLQKSYSGKIKMIYFDPPYNTGKDFVYKDNYADNLGNYLSLTGQTNEEGKKFSTNIESDGRYHSNWLNMMYPRIKLARNLLMEDGVVFISIDDNEVNNLRKVCDEIFGEDNFIANICHKSRASISNDKIISSNHNHILLYAKNQYLIFENRKNFGLKPILDGFDKEDVRGKFKLVPVDGPGGAKKGNPHYEFMGITGYWRFSKERMQKMYDDDFIVITKNNLQQKYYLHDAVNSKRTATTWWDENLYTSTATSRLSTFMGGNIFDTPKPIELLIKIIELSTSTNDIILDFFAGSGTTAHAIMQFNSEDGKNRKFICIQLPEPTDLKSEANKAGYVNIADICKERIRRAGQKIIAGKRDELDKLKKCNDGKMLQKETQEQIDALQLIFNNLDIGFKAFKLDSSNIQAWDGSIENFEINLFSAQNNIKENRSEEDVLFEILLKYGLDLNVAIEEKEVNSCNLYSIGGGVLFVCLSDNITTQVADAIGKWKEELQPVTCRALFKDNGFKDDITKTNSIQILRQYGIEEANSI